MNISHGLLLNPLWTGYFGWKDNHFDSLMKAFVMPLLEASSQISRHAVLNMRLVYDSECYRLGLGMASTGITSFGFGRSKLPFEAGTELSVEVDAERVEVKGETGIKVEALTAFALGFFFFTGG